MNGAVGENRTHDLSLTKGLRYHYATTATVVFFGPYSPTLNQGCAAITYGFREGKPGFSDSLTELVMAKSTPEKLAAALRANLKRRKQIKAARVPEPPPGPAANPPKSPRKTP